MAAHRAGGQRALEYATAANAPRDGVARAARARSAAHDRGGSAVAADTERRTPVQRKCAHARRARVDRVRSERQGIAGGIRRNTRARQHSLDEVMQQTATGRSDDEGLESIDAAGAGNA